jgi:uracil-DNA glycosylase
MTGYEFGYPKQCTKCESFSTCGFTLQVAPFFKQGDDLRLMLIGQDPTIFIRSERVKRVLMLDEPNGQLTRWLKDLFGKKNFDRLTLYATNLVKCTFEKPPSNFRGGGLKFLRPYFGNCNEFLVQEVLNYKPACVITLGEPTHKLFSSILDNSEDIPDSMQGAFTGELMKTSIQDFPFDYSPCLHIKTWRVAEVYGDSVKKFKAGIMSHFYQDK